MAPQLTSATTSDSAFEDLRRTGKTLPDELRARILSLGAAAVPPLIALLEDEDAAAEDAPGSQGRGLASDEGARGSLARLDLDLLVEAYEELAGELPDELMDHVEYLWELQSEPDEPALPVLPAPTVKVGRNDPCPCGSGKKYKRCCLE